MALISNLSNYNMYSSLVSANQPLDDRVVVVQDIVNNKVKTVGARYRDGRWIGEETGYVLELSDRAIWIESPYFLQSCVASDESLVKNA